MSYAVVLHFAEWLRVTERHQPCWPGSEESGIPDLHKLFTAANSIFYFNIAFWQVRTFGLAFWKLTIRQDVRSRCTSLDVARAMRTQSATILPAQPKGHPDTKAPEPQE